MLLRRDIIELGIVTEENYSKLGCSFNQIELINSMLWKVDEKIHGLVLDKIFHKGMNNAMRIITRMDADKLIDALIDNKEFKFVEYGTPEWDKYKKEEKINKMIKRGYTYEGK